MPTNPTPHKPGLFLLGGVLLTAGLCAWIWTGDWRYAATGAALLILSAIFAAASKDGAQ